MNRMAARMPPQNGSNIPQTTKTAYNLVQRSRPLRPPSPSPPPLQTAAPAVRRTVPPAAYYYPDCDDPEDDADDDDDDDEEEEEYIDDDFEEVDGGGEHDNAGVMYSSRRNNVYSYPPQALRYYCEPRQVEESQQFIPVKQSAAKKMFTKPPPPQLAQQVLRLPEDQAAILRYNLQRRRLMQMKQQQQQQQQQQHQQQSQQRPQILYENIGVVAQEKLSRRSSMPLTQKQVHPLVMRRYPVTVPTPRYVRRLASNLYKRPSALCLPLACQPDPARCSSSIRRPKIPVSGVIHPEESGSYADDNIPREFNVQHQRSRRYLSQQQQHQQQQQQQQQQPNYLEVSNIDGFSPASHLNAQSEKQPMPQQQVIEQKPANESKKTLVAAKNRLDAVLERYDRIFDKNSLQKDPKVNDLKSNDFIKNLKPRTPPSLQNKQSEQSDVKEKQRSEKNIEENAEDLPINRKNMKEIMKNAETLAVEEVTADMLTKLLSDLTENGLNSVILEDIGNEDEPPAREVPNKGDASSETKKQIIEVVKTEEKVNPVKETINSQGDIGAQNLPKSFTYDEIKESMSKVNSNNADFSENSSQKSCKILRRKKSKIIPKVIAEDALELHRTKSYVVNLIDTALSNHFGTVLGEKKLATSKTSMDPRDAVEVLKKHSTSFSSSAHRKRSKAVDKELCLEIAQALSDSQASGKVSKRSSIVKKNESQCSCKSSLAWKEPLFVKQLREMRWGHLKHIQREVRRLEELERFLDSCSPATFDKYNNGGE